MIIVGIADMCHWVWRSFWITQLSADYNMMTTVVMTLCKVQVIRVSL